MPRDHRDRIVKTFAAVSEGDCDRCRRIIKVGDIIHHVEPSGRYLHDGCQ